MLFWNKNKINKQVNDLNDKYNNLKNSNILENMEKLKLISDNNEEYRELYEIIKTNYNTLINDFYLDIEKNIVELENNYSTLDSKLLKNEIKNVNESIEKANYEKNQILNQINSMFVKENEIREELTPLKESYREFLKSYEENEAALDECATLFKDVITRLDNELNEIEEYLVNGQYQDAVTLLATFKEELEIYSEHLKKMPEMINFTFKILPNRYQEVLENYESMKQEGYVLFTIKMANYTEEIEGLFKSVKQAFYEFRYLEVKEDIKQLAYKINEVSVRLNQEKEAKENFDNNNDRVYSFIDDINKKFLKVKRDFYSVNGVYLINKNREDELIFIENELHSLGRIKMELETYIHSPTNYPYSTLNAKLVELSDFSDSINSKVESFQNYIYSLKGDSQYAYKYINDASIALSYYYNLLLSYNHKVLSVLYKERYDEVTGLIDIISKELVTKPIYVEKINDELKGFKVMATTLLDEMKESVKLYQNASNIIIYTNKYRSSFSVVNDVLNRAQIHFDNGEFEFAIDSVSEILQQVHPQAYAEMMKFKENNNE